MVEIQLVHHLVHEWTNSVLTGYPYFTSQKYVPYMGQKNGFDSVKVLSFPSTWSGFHSDDGKMALGNHKLNRNKHCWGSIVPYVPC